MRPYPILLTSLLLATWPQQGKAEEPDLAKELPRIKATEVNQARATFKLHPGFQLDLIGSEPLVRSPVAACYDADGRLYVVEMRGYPYPEARPTGGVSRLEDTDGDGHFDKRTEFVTGLSWPTGITAYDGGVFITEAPNIFYAKDTDGDGIADVNEKRYTGFGTQNVQGLLNGLLWGTDGWIYGSAGTNGGDIEDLKRPGSKPVSVRGRDFRFKPDGSAFEAISGGGQFGHTVDDWGHRFVCSNSNHIRQVVLPAREVDRNPALTVPAVTTDIAVEGGAGPVFRISPPEPWRIVRTRQRVADPAFVKRSAPSELHASGFFTSATGVTIYRGTAYAPEYRGNAFVGDVGGNLVHRKTVAEQGSIFVSKRADEGMEFLASSDNWFRPVNFVNTPGGTLLILDMYRETIEHPISIPEPIKKHLDLTSGRDRGRLYEILAVGSKRRVGKPALSKATTAQLVATLADPDAWWRETAQRLLIERRDASAIPLLKEVVKTRPSALGRTHALWTLDVLGGMDEASSIACLKDEEPRVREQGARLAGAIAKSSPAVLEALLVLASDANPMVRFQTALTLGDVADSRAIDALATIAASDASDRWTRAAVLSSVAKRSRLLIEALGSKPGFFDGANGREWLAELATMVGVENQANDIQALLDRFAKPGTDTSLALNMILGLGEGLKRSGGSLKAALQGPAAARIAPLFENAAKVAESAEATPAARIDAIRLLALGSSDSALKILPNFLDAREEAAIQVTSIQALADLADRGVGEAIVGRWKAMSPAVRREAAEALFARPDRVAALLDAVEARTIAATELDPARQKVLMTSGDPKLRERAIKLLGNDSRPNRAATLAQARKALELAGNREQGKAVFTKTCATCHKAEGQGAAVGPDLATVAGRTPEDLIVHILDPNREVAANYVNYVVVTRDGRSLTGIIAEETAGAVILKRAEGATDTIARGQIEEINSLGLSLMPEGLEQSLDPKALADLIAFIRSLQPTANPPAR
ncbi:PVC-type heme-binding CxxCH protein [Singulisphaera sp. PoT]|uniref:PVC-type heme-binding CxxCH protein n=1 Tax=Singulisphaera sp. PoT TaxID=3411797 RepID=UPI003BF5AD8A